jgi:serpin B
LDFINQSEESRQAVNQWVEDQTADRIVDLIPAGAINEFTRTVLVNAVYLKAPWRNTFDPDSTRPAPFTLLSGEEIEVDTMVKDVFVRTGEMDGHTLVAVPLRGDRLEMLFVLPETTEDLSTLEDTLSVEMWNEWKDALSAQEVSLFLPKFTFKTGTLSLTSFLREDGLNPLFESASGIDQILAQENLIVSDVVHQTFLAVDEGGVEAAAATAIIVRTDSVPDPIPAVRLNRPFLFAIHDTQTGMILFFGRLMNPLE